MTSSSFWLGLGIAGFAAAIVTFLLGGMEHRQQDRLLKLRAENLRIKLNLGSDWEKDYARWVEAKDRERSLTSIALPLLCVTIGLTGLAIWGASLGNPRSHLTGTDLFADLAGVGSLLAGIGTMLAVWLSYLDRQRKKQQDTTGHVINHLLGRMDGPVSTEQMRALTELARSLNENQETPTRSDNPPQGQPGQKERRIPELPGPS